VIIFADPVPGRQAKNGEQHKFVLVLVLVLVWYWFGIGIGFGIGIEISLLGACQRGDGEQKG
jgi:hypothetical protein